MNDWLSAKQAEEAAQIEEDRITAFEHTLVKRLFANVGINAAGVKAIAASEGYDCPNFQWLREQTTFPVFLGSAKIPWMQHLQIGELFGSNFTKTRFFAAYTEFVQSECFDDRRDRCGLVFNWPGIPQGGSAMVLHNYPVDSCKYDPDLRTERGTRIVRPYGHPVVVYVIESFNDFIQSVGIEWLII